MASKETQIEQLLRSISKRTEDQTMKWQRAAEPEVYQSRIGDFVVTLGPVRPPNVFGSRQIRTTLSNQLRVTKLDGTLVEVVAETSNPFTKEVVTTVPLSCLGLLNHIYEMIDGGNEDIDELLKLLR